MTEADWLASTDPRAMLEWLTGRREGQAIAGVYPRNYRLPSDRKLRLFACACHRLFHPPGFFDMSYLEVEEADGERDEWTHGPAGLAEHWCRQAGSSKGINDPQTNENTANLLREIFGNPWRSVLLGQLTSCGRCFGHAPSDLGCCHVPFSLAWNDGTVPKIAQAIYDGRRFEEMPILADALEEAGCDNEEMLRHCRGVCETCSGVGYPASPGGWTKCPACGGSGRSRGPHVRGCWALDVILGKSYS